MDFEFKGDVDLSTGGGGYVREAGLYPAVIDSVVFVSGVKDGFCEDKTVAAVRATTTDGAGLSFTLEVARNGKPVGFYNNRQYILTGYKQLGQVTKLSGVAGFKSQGAPKASARVLDLVDEGYSFVEREGLAWAQIEGAKLYFLFDADKKGYIRLQKVFSEKALDVDGASIIAAPYMDESKNKRYSVNVGAKVRKFIEGGSVGANPDFTKQSYAVQDDSANFEFKDEVNAPVGYDTPAQDGGTDGAELPF